ncbi:hypothetical protein STVA_04340 [Allostella vacuolata]|nr:hypothetical protein STVA_04340 [Stella vacuolata]
MNGNPHIGESFDRFLHEQGIHGEVTAITIKRAIVLQIAQEMAAQDISKPEMARRMKVSPARLARLLDADNGRRATRHAGQSRLCGGEEFGRAPGLNWLPQFCSAACQALRDRNHGAPRRSPN